MPFDLQQSWKTAAGRMLRRLGYRIVPYDPPPPLFGVHALRDIGTLLSGVSHPIVFDVGANVGQSIKQFVDLLPTCEIHSFEPSPTTFEVLRASVGEYPNVHLAHVGVGATRRRHTLRTNILT